MENGVLISGIICKKSLGTSSGALTHIVALEKSPEVCRAFYSNIQVSERVWQYSVVLSLWFRRGGYLYLVLGQEC